MCKKLIYLISLVLVLSMASTASADLVAHWQFDDGSGTTAVDSSGNGHDGTLLLDPQWVAGKYGGALEFAGISGQRVEMEGYEGILGTQNRTVMAWVKTTELGDWISWGQNANSQKWIGRFNDNEGNGQVGALRTECSGGYIISSTVLTDGEWHHVTSVLESDGSPTIEDIKMYVDGGLEAISGFRPVDVNTVGGRNVWIGDGHHDRPLPSVIDDVRIYDNAMTKLEIVAAKENIERVDMEIGFALLPPVIDGEIDDIWAVASTQNFVPLDDPANGSGTWKVLYDADNLYVLVDMTDDVLQNDSSSSWQDDSVEVYFDGGNTKLDTPLSGDDHQYTFGWTTDEIQGTNADGYTEGIEHAQVDTDTGWRIEIKMPWLSIQDAASQAGDLVGIDCYYNDDDDGGDSRENKMLSFSAVEGWNDASQWATAVLAIVPEPVDPGTYGLVAFYALDGDATDSSGNGIDGIIHNADTGGLGDGGSVWVDDPERGTVISFNGTAEGAFVRAGDIPQMTLTNDFTWSFWAQHSDENTADNDIILGNRMDENAVDFVPRQFIKFTPTKFEWHMNGNGDDNLDYDDIPADVWLHHTVVKTANQLTYYRNGVEHSSGVFTQPLDVPQPLFFGGDNEGSAGENWSGYMSDVAIYDRALSDGEVRYLAGERAADPSLVIYYDFEGFGNNPFVLDKSGKGNDAVVVGSVSGLAGAGNNGSEACQITGDGSYLDLDGPNFPLEDIPTTACTLAYWMKPEDTGGTQTVFSALADPHSWCHGGYVRDNQYHAHIGDADNNYIINAYEGTVEYGVWHHMALTWELVPGEHGGGAMYIDGELVAEYGNDFVEAPPGVPAANNWGSAAHGGARLGWDIDDGWQFSGLLDEFYIFKRALSQDEILEIMQGM